MPERPLSPDAFLAAAHTLVGFVDTPPQSRGQLLELMLRQVHANLGAPWSVAFIHHIGYRSHYDDESQHSAWPLPPAGTIDDLCRLAERWGILHEERPLPGDLFVTWSEAQKRFVHCGVVSYCRGTGSMSTGETYLDCVTIEGNVDEGGRANGHGVHRVTRKVCPERGDRFIRWVDLDRRYLPPKLREHEEVCATRMLIRRAA